MIEQTNNATVHACAIAGSKAAGVVTRSIGSTAG